MCPGLVWTTDLTKDGLFLAYLKTFSVQFRLNVAEKMRRWKYVMIFLLGNTLLCIVVTTILNIVDWKRVTV